MKDRKISDFFMMAVGYQLAQTVEGLGGEGI